MSISYISLKEFQTSVEETVYESISRNLRNIANIIVNKNKKYDYELDETSPEYVYLLVLSGELTRFPKGFWDDNFEENSKRILEFLFNDLLSLPSDIIFKIYNTRFTKAVKLSAAQKKVNDSPFELLKIIYPGLSPTQLFAYSRHNGYRCKRIQNNL